MACNFESVWLQTAWKHEDSFGFRVKWKGDKGFGTLDVYVDKTGLRYDSEAMSDEFCIAVLAELIKNGKDQDHYKEV